MTTEIDTILVVYAELCDYIDDRPGRKRFGFTTGRTPEENERILSMIRPRYPDRDIDLWT